MPRHLLTLFDLGDRDLQRVVDRGIELKRLRGTAEHPKPLLGKSVAVLLEKASTRTRISFEVGIHELGALPVTLIAKDTQLGRGEPLEDTSRMLSGYVHGVVFRTFAHDKIRLLADYSRIPVINGLCDMYHPCQILADLMTIQESLRGESLRAAPIAWIGDGNNMAHSWINAAALLGLDLRLACPQGYEPSADVLEKARASSHAETKITVVRDPAEAVEGARVVTTDVWASMGQEEEQAQREEAFASFCVDDSLMKKADPRAIFLHCLPAHRGEEVSASVIDGPQSWVWAEAENRLHSQKAVLELLVGS